MYRSASVCVRACASSEGSSRSVVTAAPCQNLFRVLVPVVQRHLWLTSESAVNENIAEGFYAPGSDRFITTSDVFTPHSRVRLDHTGELAVAVVWEAGWCPQNADSKGWNVRPDPLVKREARLRWLARMPVSPNVKTHGVLTSRLDVFKLGVSRELKNWSVSGPRSKSLQFLSREQKSN